MIPLSVYLSELLHIWLNEDPPLGLQAWSNLFDQSLQQWDIHSCNQLLRELRRLDVETETGATAYLLQKIGKGTLAAHTGDLEMAARIYQDVLPIVPEEEGGWILMNLGNIYYLSRQFDQALYFYTCADEVYKKTNFLNGQAKVLANLGCVHRDNGQLVKALEMFQQAAPLISENDLESQVINLSNWANTLHIAGQWAEADAKYQQALSISGQINAPHLQAQITGNLGVLYLDLGDLDKAIRFLSQDLSLQVELGDFVSQAEALNNLGMVYRKSGQVQLALDCYKRSAEIKNGLADKPGELKNWHNYIIAAIKHALPVPPQILAHATQLATEIGDHETLQWLQNLPLDSSNETTQY